MIDIYIQQLKSEDAARRREAIVALGKSNDPSALQPLAEVYRNDPEPALRDLALKAGRYLRQHTSQDVSSAGQSGAGSSSASSRLKEELSSYETEHSASSRQNIVRRKVVSPADVTRSRSYVDEALSHNMNDDNARALKALRKALELNPNIQDDGFFVSVAGAVTGDSGQAAISFILDQQQAKEFVKESLRHQKSVQTAMHLETAEKSRWSAVTLELVIYMFINVLGTVIMFFIFTESIANLPADSETLAPAQASELRAMVSSFTLVTSVIVGVISAVASAINLFVQGAAIHFVATRMFQGKGTMRYMLDNLFAL
ncbi:MAG: HEAT repeat domain-containing protein, partial [Anaerolineae bacterium]|nr:HEAT repeat domain-containing protein [Anaerolineae bacterium]